jgi:O-antigen ligase/cytochrome c-type biogenesis protein CcmH/NrfG
MTTKSRASLTPLSFWLFGGIAITTLIFFAQVSDPFNAVKFWALLVVASLLAPKFATTIWLDLRAKRVSQVEKLSLFLVGAFILALVVDLLVTDVKFTAFFGAYQRRTGLLAYLGFAILFLAASKFTKIESVRGLQAIIFGTASLMTFYGLLQHFHHDFIKWNNPYNPVLTTLGNPDFSSAVLGIFVVSAFGIFMNLEVSRTNRAISVVVGILMLVIIKFSQVTQGFLAAAVGCGFILLIWAYQKSKLWGRLTFGIGGLGALLILLGAFQIGPLTKLIFKASVTYRGDYWRAGFRMLKTHPIFGVGLDRFGAYFGQYRDTAQVLRRGPGIVSNAAHNVWIQLAATGGVLLLFTYVALMVFVGWRAKVALKKYSGNQQILVATVIGLWLTYQAQAFISIDNIGIAVWGWLFGGMIVAISLAETQASVGNSTNVSQQKGPRVKHVKPAGSDNFLANLSAAVLLIVAVLGVSMLARGENGAFNFQKVAMPKTPQDYLYFQQQVDSELAKHPVDPYFIGTMARELVQVGQNFATSGDFANATIVFTKADGLFASLIAQDPRDISALQSRASVQDSFAQIYAGRKDLVKSKTARMNSTAALVKVCELDPLNTINWLHLGKSYKAAGDLASARSVIAKISEIDPNGADLASAKKEFGA